MTPRSTLAALLCAALLAAGCASTTSGSVATGGRGRSQLLLVSSEQVMQQSLQYYDEQNREARAKGHLVTGGPEWSLEMEVRLYRDRANTKPELLRLWQHLAAKPP